MFKEKILFVSALSAFRSHQVANYF